MIVIKVPLQPLAEDVKSRHSLTEELFDAKLEGDSLVLYFRRASPNTSTAPDVPDSVPSRVLEQPRVAYARRPPTSRAAPIRRRQRMKRNRMKTRGWQVVAKITNSKGQTAVVYKPFVEALFGKRLTPTQERALVAQILRSNGNDPTEGSIDYFLMNTKEYLEQANRKEVGA